MSLTQFRGLARVPGAPPDTLYDLRHARLGAVGAHRCPAPVPLSGAWPLSGPWLGSMALASSRARLYRDVEASEWTRTGVLLVTGRGEDADEGGRGGAAGNPRLALVRREVPAQALPVPPPEAAPPGGGLAEPVDPVEDAREGEVGDLPSSAAALATVPAQERRPFAEAHPAILSAKAVDGGDVEPRLPAGYAISYKLVPLTEGREAGAPVYVSACGSYSAARAVALSLVCSDSVDAVDVYRTFPLNLSHAPPSGGGLGFPVPVASGEPVWLLAGDATPQMPAPAGYYRVDRITLATSSAAEAFTASAYAEPGTDVPEAWRAGEGGATDVLWLSAVWVAIAGRLPAPCYFADYAERSVRATFTSVPAGDSLPAEGATYVCCEATVVAVGATPTTEGVRRLAVRLCHADGTPLLPEERWSAAGIAGAEVVFEAGNDGPVPQRRGYWLDRSALGVFPASAGTDEKREAYAAAYSRPLYAHDPTADASFPALPGVAAYLGGEAAPYTWRTMGARYAFASGAVMLYGDVRTPTKAPAVALVVQDGDLGGTGGTYARTFDACLEYATPSGAVRGPRIKLPQLHALQIYRQDAERALLLLHENSDRVFARLTADENGLYRVPGLKAPYTWASALMNLVMFDWGGSYNPDDAPGAGSVLPPHAATLDEPDVVLLSAVDRPREVTYDQYRLPGSRPVAGLHAARQGEEDPVRVYDFYTLTDAGVFACSREGRGVQVVPVMLTDGSPSAAPYAHAYAAATDLGLALATRDGRVLLVAGRTVTDLTAGLLGEAVPEPLWTTPPLLAYHVRRRVLYALAGGDSGGGPDGGGGLYGYALDRGAWTEHHAVAGAVGGSAARIGYVRARSAGALDAVVVVGGEGAGAGDGVAVGSEALGQVPEAYEAGTPEASLVLQHTTDTGEHARLVRLVCLHDGVATYAGAGVAYRPASGGGPVRALLSTEAGRALVAAPVVVPLPGDGTVLSPRVIAGRRYRVEVAGFGRLLSLDAVFAPA